MDRGDTYSDFCKMKKVIYILIIVNYLFINQALSQDILYFHKIENVISNQHLYQLLYSKLDSIKQTRRQTDSRINVVFDRDVDFGIRHKRINVTFNSVYYSINLLLKNDLVILSNTSFDNDFYADSYNQFNSFYIDSSACIRYLNDRNKFYGSSKNFNSLKEELVLNEDFAFYCGDGNNKTGKGIYIEKLVKKNDVKRLLAFVQSINCEQQAFGEAGLKMLQQKGKKLSKKNQDILNYIDNRNSELSICSGCFPHVVTKSGKRQFAN